MLLSIVEKELVANQSVPKFVAAFGLQQQEIVAAYTTRANNGTITVDRERLLDHLFGVLAYARLPEGIRSSLKSQLLAWTSVQFSMKAVLAAAVSGATTCCDREHQQLYACRTGNSPRSCADPSATGYFFLNSPTTAHK